MAKDSKAPAAPAEKKAAPAGDKKPAAVPKKAAAAAAKTLGQRKKKQTKLRTKVHFFRPKTVELARKPKYVRKALPKDGRLAGNRFAVIKKPLTSESVMKKVENFNTLVFLVDLMANKRQIKQAVQAMYKCSVESVNTLIRPDGQKKAYVKLSKDADALEIAGKIGIV